VALDVELDFVHLKGNNNGSKENCNPNTIHDTPDAGHDDPPDTRRIDVLDHTVDGRDGF